MERREALRLSAAFMGYGLSGLVFSGMLNGCKVDSSLAWEPVFFTKEQAIIIGEFAEHLLPKTTTPGAKDVLVDRFLDQLIGTTYDAKGKDDFNKELTAFQQRCQEHYGKGFETCSKEERDAIFAKEEETDFTPAVYLWGNKIKEEGTVSFYRQLKGLVLFGYFSSEEIGEKVLNYDPVPGTFIGCTSLEEIGNSWSL